MHHGFKVQIKATNVTHCYCHICIGKMEQAGWLARHSIYTGAVGARVPLVGGGGGGAGGRGVFRERKCVTVPLRRRRSQTGSGKREWLGGG